MPNTYIGCVIIIVDWVCKIFYINSSLNLIEGIQIGKKSYNFIRQEWLSSPPSLSIYYTHPWILKFDTRDLKLFSPRCCCKRWQKNPLLLRVTHDAMCHFEWEPPILNVMMVVEIRGTQISWSEMEFKKKPFYRKCKKIIHMFFVYIHF